MYDKNIMTIGTDPEFVLLNKRNRNLIRANSMDFYDSLQNKIGSDGAGVPVEIRPNPSKINKLGMILDDIDTILRLSTTFNERNSITLRAGACYKKTPIGCHIHFGFPLFKRNSKHNNSDIWRYSIERGNGLTTMRTSYCSEPPEVRKWNDRIIHLIEALDTHLIPVINSFIPHTEIEKRLKRGYGRLSDYRFQKWGVEYRTPYNFIISPLLLRAGFALASLIAYHYNILKPKPYLFEKTESYYRSIIANHPNIDQKRLELINIIKPRILKVMGIYSPNPKYNGDIISLFNLIKNNRRPNTPFIDENFRHSERPLSNITIMRAGSHLDGFRDLFFHLKSKVFNPKQNYCVIYPLDVSRGIKMIELSAGMPQPKNFPSDVIIAYSGRNPNDARIGISREICNDFRRKKDCRYLIKYISRLRMNNNQESNDLRSDLNYV